MAIENKIVITCSPRITPILAKEVTSLGFAIVEKDRLSITVYGSFRDTMFLNLHLRTANKVLYHLKSFKAENGDQLYKTLVEINWERYIRSNGYVSINGWVKNDSIKDTRFANLRAKDAIVDRIQKVKGRRPDSGPDQSKSMIYLHWKENDVNVYLDTSGETISKHGYRKTPFKAPMAESLAAACILESSWDKKSPFINPMCGSGTLAIEAALIAINKAPGLMRSNFGFMHINIYNEFEWNKMVKEAEAKISVPKGLTIRASDLSGLALTAAIGNAQNAEVENYINFEKSDFRDLKLPEEPGVVFLNPEYGLRLGEIEELEKVYGEIGDFFKSKAKGYMGYVFTGNLDLAKKIGLKTKRRIELYNAKLDARLLEYELYAGSKKIGKLPT